MTERQRTENRAGTTFAAIDRGVIHRCRYLNDAPLNNANVDVRVNFLEYWEIKPAGKPQHFSSVTDIRPDGRELPSMRYPSKSLTDRR